MSELKLRPTKRIGPTERIGPTKRKNTFKAQSMDEGLIVKAMMRSSDDGVALGDLAVPPGALLQLALLRFEADVADAEALAVAVGPLVVVEHAPEEVALDRVACG